MKRAREDGEDAAGLTPPPCSFWGSISPFKAPLAANKRCRDRSVPVDALSRMMTAAVTHARLKRHGAKQLFVERERCAVCVSSKELFESSSMRRCTHCERRMGGCCARECDACGDVFCSLCSTLNCDEQFDRVFCLACNSDH